MIRLCSFASNALALLRAIDGRSVRVEEDLVLIRHRLQRMEKTMADNHSELLAKLEDLDAKVDAYTTAQGEKLVAAIAAAREAQKQEDKAASDAALEAALAKIEEIGKGLVEFSPSQN